MTQVVGERGKVIRQRKMGPSNNWKQHEVTKTMESEKAIYNVHHGQKKKRKRKAKDRVTTQTAARKRGVGKGKTIQTHLGAKQREESGWGTDSAWGKS